MNEQDARQLENILDRTNLFDMLESITYICGEKAEHVRLNWQDERLAEQWDQAARDIHQAAYADAVITLP